jgi:hypothetical protein
MLTGLGRDMGRHGTMIFGGHAAHHAWIEARASFVHGNFAATVFLCQGLVEHLLAAYLLDRRSIDSDEIAEDLMRRDAIFAISLTVRMLAKPAFRLGSRLMVLRHQASNYHRLPLALPRSRHRPRQLLQLHALGAQPYLDSAG